MAFLSNWEKPNAKAEQWCWVLCSPRECKELCFGRNNLNLYDAEALYELYFFSRKGCRPRIDLVNMQAGARSPQNAK